MADTNEKPKNNRRVLPPDSLQENDQVAMFRSLLFALPIFLLRCEPGTGETVAEPGTGSAAEHLCNIAKAQVCLNQHVRARMV